MVATRQSTCIRHSATFRPRGTRSGARLESRARSGLAAASGRPGRRGGCHGSTGAGAPFVRFSGDARSAARSATSAPTSRSATGSCRRPTASASSTSSTAIRRSCGGRRSRAPASRPRRIAANIDVVFLVHALDTPSNQRRLERELVLAFDSRRRAGRGADQDRSRRRPRPAARAELVEVALGVPVLLDQRSHRDRARRDLGVRERQPHARLPRRQWRRQVDADQLPPRRPTCRRHRRCARATAAAATPPSPPSCCGFPGEGWLIDTPGVRAVSLWLSGRRDRACLRRRVRPDGPLPFPRLQARPGAGLRGARRDRRRARSTRPGSRASSASSPKRRPSRRSNAARRSSRTAAVTASADQLDASPQIVTVDASRSAVRATFDPWTSPSPTAASSTARSCSPSWTSGSTPTSTSTRSRSTESGDPHFYPPIMEKLKAEARYAGPVEPVPPARRVLGRRLQQPRLRAAGRDHGPLPDRLARRATARRPTPATWRC